MDIKTEINPTTFYKFYKIKSNKDNYFDLEIYIYNENESEELIIYISKFEDKIKTGKKFYL